MQTVKKHTQSHSRWSRSPRPRWRRALRGFTLSLVAVFALSAVAVSTADGAEYGRCLPASVAGKGFWKKASCIPPPLAASSYTKEWVVATGAVSLEPGSLAPGPYPLGQWEYTSVLKRTHFITAAGEVVCHSGTDEGEITGPTTDEDVITLTGCKLSVNGASCTTGADAPGEIETELLETKLIGTDETEFINPTSPHLFAEFECGSPGVEFEVFGSVTGVTSAVNRMELTTKTVFGKAGQGLTAEICSPCTTIPMLFETTDKTTYQESIEIRN